MSGTATACVGFFLDGKAIGSTEDCGRDFQNSFRPTGSGKYTAKSGTNVVGIKNNKVILFKDKTSIMAVCILMSLYLIIRIILMINILST